MQSTRYLYLWLFNHFPLTSGFGTVIPFALVHYLKETSGILKVKPRVKNPLNYDFFRSKVGLPDNFQCLDLSLLNNLNLSVTVTFSVLLRSANKLRILFQLDWLWSMYWLAGLLFKTGGIYTKCASYCKMPAKNI